MTESFAGFQTAPAIDFAGKLAASDVFRELFREGMALVEETAAYLDGPGRQESRELSRAGSLGYTTESMRLTTRLMQVASWLLLQRAVNEGELSSAQAGTEKAKVKLDGSRAAIDGGIWNDLPKGLRELIDRSLRLQERVYHLDQLIYGPRADATTAANPVARDLGRLADAFGAQIAR